MHAPPRSEPDSTTATLLTEVGGLRRALFAGRAGANHHQVKLPHDSPQEGVHLLHLTRESRRIVGRWSLELLKQGRDRGAQFRGVLRFRVPVVRDE